MNGDLNARPGSNGCPSSSPECGDGDQQKLLPSWVSRQPIIVQANKSSTYSFKNRSRYRAGPTRKLRRRAVLKGGECNVLQSRISRRSLRFLQDIFTTLVDTQWRWTLLCFALSFVLSWLMFAGIWWLIAFTHGDFDPRHMNDENWRPCVVALHGFTSCFLFSIETQHTIGYGGRATTEECPEAIFVMCIQSISGMMIQAFMVGIVFAKMSRPKQRTQTLLFSRNAVICQRDGHLCLMFRVGDLRKSHIIGATVRAQLIRSRTTKEGEILPHNQFELNVGADGQAENLFFIWPCTVVHKIDADSPFYNMSAEDMLSERFEIVVILEGTIESTGQSTQARSSYLPQEVLWGHRFEPIISYSKERQGYEVDYSLFNSTVQVDTPLCSGRELAEFYRLQDELRQQTASPGYLIEEQASPTPDSRSHAGATYRYPSSSCKQFTYPHQHQHQSELTSLEDALHSSSRYALRNSSYYSDYVPPPPYGKPIAIKDVHAIDMDDEEAALLDHEKDKLCVARYPLELHDRLMTDSRSLDSCSSRGVVRSCQDLQRPRSLNASKKYLLLTLEQSSSNGNLSNSYPSDKFERAIVARRQMGKRERLRSSKRSSRSATSSKESSPMRKDLHEIVVHKCEEDESGKARPTNGSDAKATTAVAVATKRHRRSYEHAIKLQDANRASYSETNSSNSCSSSECEVVPEQQLQLQDQPVYTSV